LKEPIPPISEESAIISELSGSVNREKSDKDVKTVAVSSVSDPRARAENTANASIGEMTGERYAMHSLVYIMLIV
jgi:hypothetical protein